MTGQLVGFGASLVDVSRDVRLAGALGLTLVAAAGYVVDLDLWRAPDDQRVPVSAKCQHSDDSGPIVVIPKPKPKGWP
ncbi:hypothetical protein ACH41E_28005 [Streptomyces sp. NPDC020412]|uniref:hypothetical protein n=1 Tax=Streptomyces sp. NPDC020412 TaxID=3365073 RepID=UPI0037A7B4E6